MERMLHFSERPIDLIFGPGMNTLGFGRESESSKLVRSKTWNSFITVLTSLPPEDPHWLYKTPYECVLFCKNGERAKPLRRVRGEIFDLFKERVIERFSFRENPEEIVVFLIEKYTSRQGLFRVRYLRCLDKEMVQIKRTRTFSKEEFVRVYPQLRRRLKDLEAIIDEYPRLILGGRDRSFIKKCCYSVLMEKVNGSDFPPPLFIEENLEVHFPRVLQVINGEGFSIDPFEGIEFPFLFYEPKGLLFLEERSLLSNFLVSSKNLVLSLPFSSPEAMEETLLERKDHTLIGFKSYFLSPLELKEV